MNTRSLYSPMLSSELPPADKLRWTSRQWQEYVEAWSKGNPVSMDLYNACPGLFKEREGHRFINKQLDRSHEALNHATALMFRYAIVQVCERLNIHPVDVAFSHDLREASHRPPFVGKDEESALTFQILLDKPSYTGEVLTQMEQRLPHMFVDIMHKRGVNQPWVYLKVDDVRDYPRGYSSPWRMGSSPQGLQQGMNKASAVEDNPQVLHAWRSRAPSKFLTSAAAAGGLAQRGELYLRWLDGKERPESIVPVDEKAIEESWPSAMKFFQTWAALGIRERTALRDALSRVEPKDGPSESYDLPDNF